MSAPLRTVAVIARVDLGKTTLADAMLTSTGDLLPFCERRMPGMTSPRHRTHPTTILNHRPHRRTLTTEPARGRTHENTQISLDIAQFSWCTGSAHIERG
jgi:hypothetical protein